MLVVGQRRPAALRMKVRHLAHREAATCPSRTSARFWRRRGTACHARDRPVTPGQVTIVTVGDVVITAVKAADANYKGAQASYSMSIAPRTVGIKAWIGSSDTEVSFLSDYLEMDFTRSTDLACDPKSYSLCSNAAQTSASASPLTDSVATLRAPTAYWLKHGSSVTEPIVLPEGYQNTLRFP